MNILLIFPGFILAFIIVFYYEYKIRNLSAKPKNKVHFYVARDKNGELLLYISKPFRGIDIFHSHLNGCIITSENDFSNFGLNKDDYTNLKWEDDPVEVFINIKD